MSYRWWPAVAVLGIAVLVRLPHYDITLFAGDQIALVAQARRILSGDWNVIGPDAAGIDIIGPLYAFLLAGLLWIRDDPGTLGLFGVACEVAGAWFVYDAARRVAGTAIGVVAAVTYALAPALVLSTRLIWNPSLLPALVACGWWLLVRHCETASTPKLLAIALAAGFAPTLHATGVFFSLSLILGAIAARLPSPGQLVAAAATCVLPLTPVLLRLSASAAGGDSFAARIGLMNVSETLRDVRDLTLGFPIATIGWHWTAVASASAPHAQVAVAGFGFIRGSMRRDRYWPCWLAIGTSTLLNVTSGLIYTGHLSWYYFIALTPGLCVCLAYAITDLSRLRSPAAWAMVVLAAAHVPFLDRFDRPAVATGILNLEAPKLMRRVPSTPGPVVNFPTLRDIRLVGSALREVVPDGATAMMVGHGIRSELWRESGAELLPRADVPRERWSTEFLLVGPGATVLRPDARLIGNRICAFERPALWSSRARHRPAEGWEQPQFADGDWTPFEVPRRATRPSLRGLNQSLSVWRAPRVALRGQFGADTEDRRRAFGVVIHSAGNSAHWIASAFLNGKPVTPAKERVIHSPFARNHEWLFDVTGRLHVGENLIALDIDGQTPHFDFDVFEIPCLDSEWYR